MEQSHQQYEEDKDENVILPTLKYGYRTAPLDWPELKQIILVEQNLDKLTRNEKEQRSYMLYTRNIKKEWRSVMDYILCTKFDLERRRRRQPTTTMDDDDNNNNNNHDKSHGLWLSYPPLSQLQGIHTRLVKNDFPYYFVHHVEHWILWKIGEECSDGDIVRAKSTLEENLGNVKDFLHWINPPHLKSLPEVDHVHILVLREKSS